MYSRSDVRHACFRAKKNAASEDNKKILAEVEKLLSPGQRWDNFTKIWDVLIDKIGQIVIIKPETNYDYIHSTCLEASLYTKKNLSFDDFSDRQKNIILTVETLMLEKLMTWENYNKNWGVELDPVTKIIKTKLYNAPSRQIEVTPEMITASMKDADGSPLSQPTVLEAKPMSEEQKKAFEEFLAKKSSQQVKE
jgi:hypothetical protein